MPPPNNNDLQHPVKTFRISSNATLFLRFFVPIFWIVFFGALTTALLFYPNAYVGNTPLDPLRWIVLAIFMTGVAVLYLTLMRLKRVELDKDFVYVTNYFKNVRYPYHNVEALETSDFLFIHLGMIKLQQPGRFGRRIPFVLSTHLLNLFLKDHPKARKALSGEDR